MAAFALAFTSLGAVTTRAEARTVRATLPVEYSATDREHVKLVQQIQTLRSGTRIDLDLLLDLEAGSQRVASAGAGPLRGRALRRSVEIGDEATARLGEVTCLTDANAALNYTRQNYLKLKLFENFDHVVFKVYPGDKADFAMNDAACVFDPAAPGKKRFHLRGRYQALINPTATGVIVQLRPVR